MAEYKYIRDACQQDRPKGVTQLALPRSKMRSAGQLMSFMDSLVIRMVLGGRECKGLTVVVEEGVDAEAVAVGRLEVLIEEGWLLLLEDEWVLVEVGRFMLSVVEGVFEVLAGGGLVVLSAIMSYDDYDAIVK